MGTRRQIVVRGSTYRQGGAVVIEFALVFIIFFMVMYGAIAYGIIFALQHSLTHAANEGARASVQNVGDIAARRALAQTTASNAVMWLGARAPTPTVTSAPCAATPFVCVNVSLAYDYAANPIIPPLPGLGLILPASITAQATVQLDAVN